jgi:arylsulfatase A-like enzyme
MKCPLVIAGPGIPAGRETRQFTYLFDIFPTVARLAGVELPDPMDGRDLSPLWTGSRTPWRDTVFLPFTDTMRSIRDERWKLIVYPRTNHRQLFDLRRDPDERHNLAADPRHAATVARLEKRMIESQKQFGDRQPLSTQTPAPIAIDLSKDYVRKPDESQPAWVVEKYFRQGGR